MENGFSLASFTKKFPDEESCLEEIRRIRYPGGILCRRCERITRHYRLKNRPVYECKFCRHQTHPLVGTAFEKSTTPLKQWFFAMFLMTHTRAQISAKDLQRQLGVTYKTAWRMYNTLYKLMERNKGDLLTDTQVRKWVIWNTIELKVVRKSQEET